MLQFLQKNKFEMQPYNMTSNEYFQLLLAEVWLMMMKKI